MVGNINLLKNRVFIIALAVSLLWHLFWISTIKIISKPGRSGKVKFARVSFLGPILNKGTLELKVRPKDRSFLEKRYMRAAAGMPDKDIARSATGAFKYKPRLSPQMKYEDKLVDLIDESLSGQKPEPDRAIDVSSP